MNISITTIIIDEVQRTPALLNDIQKLIEEDNLSFILCGSSARKIVRGGANMLGGRASRVVMRSLCISEIDNFELITYINRGGIPSHYLSDNYRELLKSYVENYLEEEIKGEALVRNVVSFNRFLELVGISNGTQINFTNMARDVGVDAKTIREYFQILVDTLLGYYIEPYFDKKKRTNISQTSKFYLFDIGVVNYLKGISITKEIGEEFGKSFESIVINEIMNYKSYTNSDFDISYWKTYEQDEIDLVLGDAKIAIEIKSGKNIDNSDLKRLIKFKNIYNPARSIVIANVDVSRKLDNGIEIINYREFVKLLWSGKLEV